MEVLCTESLFVVLQYCLLREQKNIILMTRENIFKNSFLEKMKKCYLIKNKYIDPLKFKIQLLFKNIKIYGNDHLFYSPLYCSEFILLEDGVANYMESNFSFKEKIYVLILNFKLHKKFGFSNKIKKIYLRDSKKILDDRIKKLQIINLKELWNKKTLEEQNEILDIFSFDLNIKEKIKGRDIILFTQPLSEDNIITEEEKLKIYSEIIKKYPKDRLVIKTHPREKTNYKDIFNEYLVLDNPFPFEILNLLDVKFNKAITLFSTAALGLGDEVEVDFYGTEVHDKILERFGSCDNIMERNCFLKEE